MQLTNAVYRLIHHEPTRNILLYETELVERLCPLLLSSNPILAGNAEDTLELIQVHNRIRPSLWKLTQTLSVIFEFG